MISKLRDEDDRLLVGEVEGGYGRKVSDGDVET